MDNDTTETCWIGEGWEEEGLKTLGSMEIGFDKRDHEGHAPRWLGRDWETKAMAEMEV